jgi:LPXTG-site transpeptidase (sortase) family protein
VRLAGAAAVALALAAACSSGGGADAGTAPTADVGPSMTTTTTKTTTTTAPAAVAPQSLPPAPALPDAPVAGPEPAALTIGELDVDGAPVRPVGVDDRGEMEVPGVAEVGWYRFGARPGEPGAAVLAAHIAYDGVDGVFRHLDDLSPGDAVTVALDDGSARDYVVTVVTQVPKTELPADVWARDGDQRLVLITCGGEFDQGAGHYRDNVVAYARPA